MEMREVVVDVMYEVVSMIVSCRFGTGIPVLDEIGRRCCEYKQST